MRKKFKQVLCMISALVVMICCAVPAFADDIGNSYTTWNDTIKQNVFSCIPDSDKTDYYTVIAAPNGSGFTYTIIFCKSSSSITYFGNSLHCFVSKSDYNAFACVLVTSETNLSMMILLLSGGLKMAITTTTILTIIQAVITKLYIVMFLF